MSLAAQQLGRHWTQGEGASTSQAPAVLNAERHGDLCKLTSNLPRCAHSGPYMPWAAYSRDAGWWPRSRV